MILTPDEEREIADYYDRVAWKYVRKFLRRYGNEFRSKYAEDLHSECMVVLCEKIVVAQTFDELRYIPVLDLLNAITRYIMGNQAFTIGINTKKFREEMSHSITAMNYDFVNYDMEIRTVRSKYYRAKFDVDAEMESGNIENVDTAMAFQQFYESLNDREKMILDERHDGKWKYDTAEKIGVSRQRVGHIVRRLSQRYKEFVQ